jgi:hypothetical protein
VTPRPVAPRAPGPFTSLIATPSAPVPSRVRPPPEPAATRLPTAPSEPTHGHVEPRPRRPARVRRSRVWARVGIGLAGGVFAAMAVALLVELAPAIRAWSGASTPAFSAETARTISDDMARWFHEAMRWSAEAARRIADRMPDVSPERIAGTASDHATDLAERARSLAAWRPPDLSATGLGWVTSRTAVPPPIRVAVNSDPWSHVEVDGVSAGPTPFTIELVPGTHRFRAEMANGRTVERELQVTAEQNRVVLR